MKNSKISSIIGNDNDAKAFIGKWKTSKPPKLIIIEDENKKGKYKWRLDRDPTDHFFTFDKIEDNKIFNKENTFNSNNSHPYASVIAYLEDDFLILHPNGLRLPAYIRYYKIKNNSKNNNKIIGQWEPINLGILNLKKDNKTSIDKFYSGKWIPEKFTGKWKPIDFTIQFFKDDDIQGGIKGKNIDGFDEYSYFIAKDNELFPINKNNLNKKILKNDATFSILPDQSGLFGYFISESNKALFYKIKE